MECLREFLFEKAVTDIDRHQGVRLYCNIVHSENGKACYKWWTKYLCLVTRDQFNFSFFAVKRLFAEEKVKNAAETLVQSRMVDTWN
mgnify:CR=1 FL=1